MSEEERKKKHIAVRIISSIARIAGFATFLFGLFLFSLFILPSNWFTAIGSSLGVKTDVTTTFLHDASFCSVILFWPFAIIGLILSIVTFNIERGRYLRVLPLAFVVGGILLYAFCYFVSHMYAALTSPPSTF